MKQITEDLSHLPESGRIMALDVGDVRTGIAISDSMQILASPYSVLEEAPGVGLAEKIAAVARAEEAVALVVGLPLSQHGERGPQAEKVVAFCAQLEAQFGLPIVFCDERFTTVSAERSLIDAGMRRKKRKGVVDKVAAAGILRHALDQAVGARARAKLQQS